LTSFPGLPTLETAYQEWRERQSGDRPQLVLIAAAGGGIRASFWTSVLVTRLADQVENFETKLFAASGVSGGSLGLGLSYALLSNPDGRCVDDKDKIKEKKFETCVHRFHQQDFLAGPLAATLAGYPPSLLVPWLPSRSAALELGFEKGLRASVGHGSKSAEAFSRPLTSLWGAAHSHPLLLLNATLASNGERAMTADVNVRPWLRWNKSCKINLAETVMPTLSAAMGASARFPFVTDPGWVEPHLSGCHDLETVADGGYFDNYGAATLLDMVNGLGTVRGSSKSEKTVDVAKDLKLVVIQITSDPERDMGCLFAKLSFDRKSQVPDFCADAKPVSSSRTEAQTELRWQVPDWLWINNAMNLLEKMISAIIPDTGLFYRDAPSMLGVLRQARSVNGIDVAEKLFAETCARGGSYYHFASLPPASPRRSELPPSPRRGAAPSASIVAQ
jgi:hypothetical protein